MIDMQLSADTQFNLYKTLTDETGRVIPQVYIDNDIAVTAELVKQSQQGQLAKAQVKQLVILMVLILHSQVDNITNCFAITVPYSQVAQCEKGTYVATVHNVNLLTMGYANLLNKAIVKPANTADYRALNELSLLAVNNIKELEYILKTIEPQARIYSIDVGMLEYINKDLIGVLEYNYISNTAKYIISKYNYRYIPSPTGCITQNDNLPLRDIAEFEYNKSNMKAISYIIKYTSLYQFSVCSMQDRKLYLSVYDPKGQFVQYISNITSYLKQQNTYPKNALEERQLLSYIMQEGLKYDILIFIANSNIVCPYPNVVYKYIVNYGIVEYNSNKLLTIRTLKGKLEKRLRNDGSIFYEIRTNGGN